MEKKKKHCKLGDFQVRSQKILNDDERRQFGERSIKSFKH